MTQILAIGKASFRAWAGKAQRFWPAVASRSISRRQGFTLIEMVVVVALIAIVAAIAIPAIARQSPARALQLASNRLQAVLSDVCEMADRDGRVLAMGLSQRGYGVREFREARWLPVTNSGALQDTVVPENVQIALWLNQRQVALGTQLPAKPQLVCVGAADLPDFRIDLKADTLSRTLSPNLPKPGQALSAGLIRNTAAP